MHTEADGYGFICIGEAETDIETDYVDSSDGIMFYNYIETIRTIRIPDGEEINM